MELILKHQIIDTARQYIAAKGMSQAAFARHSGVSASYLSNILNGIFDYRASGDKAVVIADRYFEMIARASGMSLIVAYWKTVETPQFIETLSALEDAKARACTKLIVGETGCGKTYSANKFKEHNPVTTFRITVSSLHKINDILEDIAQELDIKLATRKTSRLRDITSELKKLSMEGRKPVIVIDEAENLTHAMIGACKALYDAIEDYCGFVMIGTPELLTKLDRMVRYGKEGVLQFRRRTKAGTVILSKIDRKRDFDAFLGDVRDRQLHTLLKGLCANYGELHDFLEPALRSAAEDGAVLTDEYFRTMYKVTR